VGNKKRARPDLALSSGRARLLHRSFFFGFFRAAARYGDSGDRPAYSLLPAFSRDANGDCCATNSLAPACPNNRRSGDCAANFSPSADTFHRDCSGCFLPSFGHN